MDLCVAAAAASDDAVTRTTCKEQISAWKRWCKFLTQIEYDEDEFLDNVKPTARTHLLSCFAQAVREGSFSRSSFPRLGTSTVRSAVDNVEKIFRDYDRPDLRLDRDRKIVRVLSKQYSGYKNKDPAEKQQVAIPACVVRTVTENQSTEQSRAIADLVVIALYFAMRSCEYSKVPQSEDRKTKVISVDNVQFYMNGRYLEHDDPHLTQADFVSLTFEEQKNGEKMETVTQHCSGDRVLCPVRAAASIVRRIRKLKSSSGSTTINAYSSPTGKLAYISSAMVKESLRAAVSTIGETKLGFLAKAVGTHSLRSGGAMAMHLAEIPVYTIMIIGRWSSDAFLRYIRRQVAQFSQNISRRMLATQFFIHVPNFDERVSHLDPRTCNNINNAQTRVNVGGQPALSSRLPAFAMWT